MIGCKFFGIIILICGAAGLLNSNLLTDHSGFSILSRIGTIFINAGETNPLYFGVTGAIPIQLIGRILVFSKDLEIKTPIYVWFVAIMSGLLMVLRSKWHKDNRGAFKLDGIPLFFGLWFIIWYLAAIYFVFTPWILYLFQRSEQPIWANCPLWNRSLVFVFGAPISIIAIKKLISNNYAAYFWLTGLGVIQIFDNCICAIITQQAGSIPSGACVLACWPTIVSLCSLAYFRYSKNAMEYLYK